MTGSWCIMHPDVLAGCNVQSVNSRHYSFMTRTLPLSAAQSSLAELVAGMVPGDQLVLTTAGEPVAIVSRPPRSSWPSEPGTAKDRTFWMAPDFDAPLDDFAEYME